MNEGITLVTRRTIGASAARLFDVWTEPEQLRAWWGPKPITCSGAEVDLRVGGRYRIDNALPDGTTLSIEGEFQVVGAPHRLVYTWRCGEDQTSRVTVRFEPRGDATEVIVIHEQIPNDASGNPTTAAGRDVWTGSSGTSLRAGVVLVP